MRYHLKLVLTIQFKKNVYLTAHTSKKGKHGNIFVCVEIPKLENPYNRKKGHALWI